MRDQDVRRAVRGRLEADHADDSDTRIVEEMGIWSGSVRIDLAVINGELSGYELKSASDNLSRLPLQALMYSEVFDRMTIVTAEKHLNGCLGTVPDWWGIVIASGKSGDILDLSSIRSCERNTEQSPLQIARLLWKTEALETLTRHQLDGGIRSKPVDTLHSKLAEELPLDILKNEVRVCLKSRSSWLG